MTPETHEPQTYRIPAPDGTEVALVRTWTDFQIARMLRGALDIVDELDPPDDLRLSVFASAVNLTGQMTPRESKVKLANMSALENGRN